jgi:hypothetical protein
MPLTRIEPLVGVSRSATARSNRAVVEFARLRRLHHRVEGYGGDAPAQIADDGDVVAGAERRRGAGFDPDPLRLAEDADLDQRGLDSLAQRVALQFPVDVVDANERLSGEQRRAEALLKLLLIGSSRHDRHGRIVMASGM